ncbi:MAG: dihydroneopterin aldolase [Lentimicrobiaceae bacterium]|jgi:dihydroneopterin aldolase|nr:dihydroneopterin aldolase [Lentimicrobiaceae bacterium]
MGKIQLEGMEFFAYHGCFAEERIIGTRFLVDLELFTDTRQAEQSDDLTKTINYQALYLLVKQEMEKESHLLEHVAQRILTSIHQTYPEAYGLKVKVSKMNPPLGGKLEKVSLTLTDTE